MTTVRADGRCDDRRPHATVNTLVKPLHQFFECNRKVLSHDAASRARRTRWKAFAVGASGGSRAKAPWFAAADVRACRSAALRAARKQPWLLLASARP